jgi:hypothetical protein
MKHGVKLMNKLYKQASATKTQFYKNLNYVYSL